MTYPTNRKVKKVDLIGTARDVELLGSEPNLTLRTELMPRNN